MLGDLLPTGSELGIGSDEPARAPAIHYIVLKQGVVSLESVGARGNFEGSTSTGVPCVNKPGFILLPPGL